jgi:hypothetical protein
MEPKKLTRPLAEFRKPTGRLLKTNRAAGIEAKATATALAEAGATSHQIMAITGHQSVDEVERYTKAANRVIGENEAMSKLGS